eukprot:TRINITY_DN35597_c0_g1_i1.p1 TRINITY_DN35597_c0_g1~~TRINITY_DN35597_c0_g1_i1.p1  ORF type:complete len:1444 (+),score=497.58 TRINITY_DN35597_c0_g1_i1:305-4333(+)
MPFERRLDAFAAGRGRMDWLVAGPGRPEPAEVLRRASAVRKLTDMELLVFLRACTPVFRKRRSVVAGLGAPKRSAADVSRGIGLYRLVEGHPGAGTRCHSAAAALLAQDGRAAEALVIIDTVHAAGLRPTAECAAAMFDASSHSATASLELMDKWQQRGWRVPQVGWASIVTACARYRRGEDVQKVFGLMSERSADRGGRAAAYAAAICHARSSGEVASVVATADKDSLWPHADIVHACIEAARALASPALAKEAVLKYGGDTTAAMELSLGALYVSVQDGGTLAKVLDKLLSRDVDGDAGAQFAVRALSQSKAPGDAWHTLADHLRKRSKNQEAVNELMAAWLLEQSRGSPELDRRKQIASENTFDVQVDTLVELGRAAAETADVRPYRVLPVLKALTTKEAAAAVAALPADRVITAWSALESFQSPSWLMRFPSEQPAIDKLMGSLCAGFATRIDAVLDSVPDSDLLRLYQAMILASPSSMGKANVLAQSAVPTARNVLSRVERVFAAQDFSDDEIERLCHLVQVSRLSARALPAFGEAVCRVADALAAWLPTAMPTVPASLFANVVCGAEFAGPHGQRKLRAALSFDAAPKLLPLLAWEETFRVIKALARLNTTRDPGPSAMRLLRHAAGTLAADYDRRKEHSHVAKFASQTRTLWRLLKCFVVADVESAALVCAFGDALRWLLVEKQGRSEARDKPLDREAVHLAVLKALRQLSKLSARVTEPALRVQSWQSLANLTGVVKGLWQQGWPEIMELLSHEAGYLRSADRRQVNIICHALTTGPGGTKLSVSSSRLGTVDASRLATFVSSAARLGVLDGELLELVEERTEELLERAVVPRTSVALLLCAFAVAKRVPSPAALRSAKSALMDFGPRRGVDRRAQERDDGMAGVLAAVAAFSLAEPLVLSTPLAHHLTDWLTDAADRPLGLSIAGSAAALGSVVLLDKVSVSWRLSWPVRRAFVKKCFAAVTRGTSEHRGPMQRWAMATVCWAAHEASGWWTEMGAAGAEDEKEALQKVAAEHLEWHAAGMLPHEAASVLWLLAGTPAEAARFGPRAADALGRGCSVRWRDAELLPVLPHLGGAMLRVDAAAGGLTSDHIAELTRKMLKALEWSVDSVSIAELGVILQCVRCVGKGGGALATNSCGKIIAALRSRESDYLSATPVEQLRILDAVATGRTQRSTVVGWITALLPAVDSDLTCGQLCLLVRVCGAVQAMPGEMVLAVQRRLQSDECLSLTQDELDAADDGLSRLQAAEAPVAPLRRLLRDARRGAEWKLESRSRRSPSGPAALSLSVLGLPPIRLPQPDLVDGFMRFIDRPRVKNEAQSNLWPPQPRAAPSAASH